MRKHILRALQTDNNKKNEQEIKVNLRLVLT